MFSPPVDEDVSSDDAATCGVQGRDLKLIDSTCLFTVPKGTNKGCEAAEEAAGSISTVAMATGCVEAVGDAVLTGTAVELICTGGGEEG